MCNRVNHTLHDITGFRIYKVFAALQSVFVVQVDHHHEDCIRACTGSSDH